MADERREYYIERLKQFGPTAKGVGWSSEEKQKRRFQILCEAGIGPKDMVVDVGCGVGHLCDFLISMGHDPQRYVGFDAIPEFIEEARKIHPFCRFEVASIGGWREPGDFVVASGVFNVFPPYEMRMSIVKLFGLARKCFAFNCLLEDLVDPPHELENFEDPVGLFAFCHRLTRCLAFRSDYHPRDITFYLYREHWAGE